MDNFIHAATKLARNPLGIIALFIVLIYGIANLTFAYGKNLPEGASWVFVSFIIVYPFIVLYVFYKLVKDHHWKLYAPEDFPRSEDFLACFYGNQEAVLTRVQSETQVPETPDTTE